MSKHKIDDFKQQALEYRANNLHLSVTEVCKNLGIANSTDYKWARLSSKSNSKITTRGSGNYESDKLKK